MVSSFLFELVAFSVIHHSLRLKMDYFTLVTIVLCLNFVNATFYETYDPAFQDVNEPRSFFFLPPIIPLNSLKQRKASQQKQQPCMGDCGFSGRCSSKTDCINQGGTASGLCSDNVVCCIVYKKCGSITSAETSYFVNPDYPDTYQGGSQCVLKVIKSNSNICQLRINFKEFSLLQPSNEGKCENDFFTTSNCQTNKICGENKDQHVYMDFPEGSDSLTLVVDTNAASKEARKWNLEVKQISCDSIQLAPSGCLMYFTGTSGSVSSFNFGEPKLDDVKQNRLIRGLNYGICVHSKTDYCSIEWNKTSDPFSFSLSGNSSWINTRNLTDIRGYNCQNNFIVIANPYQNGTFLNEDRFCGLTFTPTMSFMKPYILHVVMGQNSTQNSADEGNRGFKLNFRLLPCRN